MVRSFGRYRNTMNKNDKGTAFQNAIFARNCHFEINDRMAAPGEQSKDIIIIYRNEFKPD